MAYSVHGKLLFGFNIFGHFRPFCHNIFIANTGVVHNSILLEKTGLNFVDLFRQIGPYRRACRVTTTPGTTREVRGINKVAMMARHYDLSFRRHLGHSYTEEGGASPVPGGSWLAQVCWPCFFGNPFLSFL